MIDEQISKDDGRVGAWAVCSNGDGRMVFHSYLGTG